MTSDKCIQCHERDALPEQTRCYECGGYVTVVDEVAKIGPARMAALDRLMARLEASEKPRQAKTRIIDDLMAQPFIARLEGNEGTRVVHSILTGEEMAVEVSNDGETWLHLGTGRHDVSDWKLHRFVAATKSDEAYETCIPHDDFADRLDALRRSQVAKPEPSWAARKAEEYVNMLLHQWDRGVLASHLTAMVSETIAECARVAAGHMGEDTEGVKAIRKLGE